jgi:PAS domain S-box-containing protein
VLASFRSVTGLEASVVVVAERIPMTENLRQSYWILILTVSLIAALIWAMTSLLTSWLLRPLQRITASAKILQSGDLGHRATVSGHDEFDQLAHTLNDMAASIQTSYQRLEEQVAQRTAELSQRNQELQREIQEREHAQAILGMQEASFQDLFEHAPIALWREDFSQVKLEVDLLVAAGVTDLIAYYLARPEELDALWAMITVLNVNQTCVNVMGAEDKSELMPKMRPLQTQSSQHAFLQQVQALAQGKTHLVIESETTRMDGQPLFVRVEWSISPGHEETAASVLVATVDITDLRQATEQIRLQSTALSAAANAIVITDHQGIIQWVNPAFTRLTGYPKGEAHGSQLSLLSSGHQNSQFYEELWTTITSGQVWRGTLRNRHKDGHIYIEEQTITPVRNETDQITHFVAIKQDVTERVQIEESLKRQLEELRIVQLVASLGTNVSNEDEIIEQVTHLIGTQFYPDHFGVMLLEPETSSLAPHASYHGVSEDALTWRVRLGEGVAGRVASSGQAMRLDDVAQDPIFLSATDGIRSELCVPVKVGEKILGIINAESKQVAAFTTNDERLLSTIAGQLAIAIERARLFSEVQRRNLELTILYDLSLAISGILRSEDLLRYLADHMRTILKPQSLFIALLDEETDRMEVAVAWEEGTDLAEIESLKIRLDDAGLTGWVLKNRTPLLVSDLLKEDLPVAPRHMTGQVARSWLGVPMFVRDHMIGVISVQSFEPHRYGESHLSFVEALASQAAIAIENARLFDQSQGLLAQTRGQAQQMRRIIATLPDGVILLSHDHRVIMTNPTADTYLAMLTGQKNPERLTHLGTLQIASLLDRHAPLDRPSVDVVMLGADPQTFEVYARPILPDEDETGWVVVIHNVTEDRQRQAYQQAQERLATVGQLSAGIAHDFNNILGAIVLYAQMLKRQTDLPEKYQNYLVTISDQANHATNLIRQILDFSRRSIMKRTQVDLVPFLTDLVRLLSRTLPDNIQVSLGVDTVSAQISADETRLQQALMNLAVNARDAMPDGGTVRFELMALEIDDVHSAPLPDMPPGRWLRLTVSDTGLGMSQDVQTHLFEPFYSTKDRGKGTGLGLAQVYGIVKQHDGFIDVKSQEEEGTTFSIYLSALDEPEVAKGDHTVEGTAGGNGETILVAEDNPASRMALGDVLSGLGYHVLLAEDGQEALEIYQSQSDQVDLILSDMVMPNMGGVDLYRHLVQERSELKLIIMTGYPLQDGGAEMLQQGIIDWIAKPFSTEELAAKLASALTQ